MTTDKATELVANALSDIKFGLDFAYEQGLHEFGYDPARVAADLIEAQSSLLSRMGEALEEIQHLRGSNYDSDRAWALAMQLRAQVALKGWLGKSHVKGEGE